ncbi:MAG: hypothetical protein ACHQ15_04705, partial [Candidatus Limnocylindrales bacterium]
MQPRQVTAALLVVAWLLVAHAPLAAAGSPTPEPLASGDVRTSGEGAGLVGAPFLALGGVIVVGLAVAGLTVAYV